MRKSPGRHDLFCFRYAPRIAAGDRSPDEAMHNLLMQRGEIIDRLIKVKQTLGEQVLPSDQRAKPR